MGGRWQENSAAGSGEDMELLFSYLSRWGLTKYLLIVCKLHALDR